MPLEIGEDGQDDGGDRNGTCSDFASPLHSRYLPGYYNLDFPIINLTGTLLTPPLQELHEDTAHLRWQEIEGGC